MASETSYSPTGMVVLIIVILIILVIVVIGFLIWYNNNPPPPSSSEVIIVPKGMKDLPGPPTVNNRDGNVTAMISGQQVTYDGTVEVISSVDGRTPLLTDVLSDMAPTTSSAEDSLTDPLDSN